jgi:Ctr copper transporter family
VSRYLALSFRSILQALTLSCSSFKVHLVPESAIVQTYPDVTFGDVRQAMAKSDDTSDVFIGCGKAPIASAPSRRRHLSMVNGASACNNSTNFYCWMSCLSIPSADKAKTYLDTGNSLYCLDSSILADSGNNVSKAVSPCLDGAMSASCMGSWQPTATGVIAQEVILQTDNGASSSESTNSKQFCYGGTSMYMDGFHWTDSTCVIYLFSSWVLTTPAKLVFASFGTIFFGIALELVIQRRRLLMANMSAGRTRLAASAIFYGLQLTMGYFIMLVIMTYSGPLFFSVIVGLIGGHLLFNAQDAVFGKSTDKEGMKSDEGFEEKTKTGSSEDDIPEMPAFKPKEKSKSTIAEGFTPCCQNEL